MNITTLPPLAMADTAQHSDHSPSASVATVSPSIQLFSHGHSTRSSMSSISVNSSLLPLPARDSFDLYNSIKRLEDVREEPQERDDEDEQLFGDAFPESGYVRYYSSSPPTSPSQMHYSLGDHDDYTAISSERHHHKRQRSANDRSSITDRVTTRFGSISRKWKTRSISNPHLSITTKHAVSSRSNSAASNHIISPALSAISKHESQLPGSPLQISMEGTLRESAIVPFYMDVEVQDEVEAENDCLGHATTPLLPPMVAEASVKTDVSLQSPLQSPAIGPVSCDPVDRFSAENIGAYLPSPPLSARPSVASIPRSPSALQCDIPPLTLYEGSNDPWDNRLGHANFSIHPEPYVPDCIDLDNYQEFRANWALARKQYTQHIARTVEHYGGTSRVYMLTQQKWDEIDSVWRREERIMSKVLAGALRHASMEVNSPKIPGSPNLLERPLTKVVLPAFDQSGKFPEMGDADIVGPLAVVPARAPELQRKSPHLQPISSKKRNLFKYLSDVLSRHSPSR